MRIVELEAEIAALGADLEACRDELAEAVKLIELQSADLQRYETAIASMNRPHCPERTDDEHMQLAWFRVLVDQPEPENDTEQADQDKLRELPTPGKPEEDRPKTNRRHAHGRRKLDLTSLPRQQLQIDPPEVIAANGDGFRLVGEEVSSRLAFRPGTYVHVEVVRRKWARVERVAVDLDGAGLPDRALPPVVIAELPDCVWPRYMADPSAIANVVVSKYGDILPLNRQQTISRRHGFELARSTLCDWLGGAYDALYRIVDAMHADALAHAHCIATDATSARLKGKGSCDLWHVFVLIADRDHIVFRHAPEHTGDIALSLFEGFEGFLLADATSILDVVFREEPGTEVGCWAHLRRYAWKAIETERDLAYEMLALIWQLFALEREWKDLAPDERLEQRRARAAPVLTALDRWIEEHRDVAEPRGRMRAAMTYYENQRVALRQFLRDGRLPIHNNGSERQLRNLVLGRANWLYFANETGLAWYCTFRSLIASCALHNLNPQDYLEQVLRLAPHWPVTRMLDLTPKHWKATVANLDDRHRAILTPLCELKSQLVSSSTTTAAA